MSTSQTTAASEPEVLVRREGGVLRITLNRPRAINAFNRAMAEMVIEAVTHAQTSDASAIVLDGAGERGFCGGGDIKAMSAGSTQEAVDFLRTEYLADAQVAASRVPVVGIMDGITMGGGIGLTGHAHVRIVTERSRLAMPETRIGIVPDVGGHLLLAHAPGRLGELLAITSGNMTAADAIALGFADHFVSSDQIEALIQALRAGEDLAEVIERFATPAPESDLLAAREWFDPIAESALGPARWGAAGEVPETDPRSAWADPVAAAQRLLAGLESSTLEEAQKAAAAMREVCPVSVAVTLAQIDRTRREALDLAGVLTDDLRVVGRLVGRGDFREGVRAQVIDKDGAPQWCPATLADLEREKVSAVLAPFAPGEVPLTL